MACRTIGIDLGTTYSCVGVWKNGRVEIIANNYGNRMTPSCVAFTDYGVVVGDAAVNQIAINPANTVYGVKRMIGRRFADQTVQEDMKHWPFKVVSGIDGQAMIEVQDKGETKRYTPEYMTSSAGLLIYEKFYQRSFTQQSSRGFHISSLVLGKLKTTAEYYLDHPVTDAVITVPANYGNAQRQATFDAARLAGLNVLRIVNEPTAAALAYGFENIVSTEPRIVLVYDLGGGTLDVSILAIDKQNQFEVKATAGNAHLGGDDFDNRMLAYFIEEFTRKYQQDLSNDKRAVRRLYAVCERTKRMLSESVIGSVEVDNLYGGRDFQAKIKRELFETLCADLFQNTILSVEKALVDANLPKGAIDEIVLVGGSSRIPKIQELLREYFAGQRMNKTINPDEAVAHGAAILAAKLGGVAASNVQSIKLSDITGPSLGIRNVDGFLAVAIPRGTRIPVQFNAEWCTSADNQTSTTFRVFEGDQPLADDNDFLGSFTIIDHPSLPARQVEFNVVTEVDASAVLHVSATEKSTGKKNQISFTRRVAA